MLALIGGTGFEEEGIITDAEEIEVDTPWGKPAAPLIIGKLGGVPLIFLRRHGVKHEFAPHVIPYRANIWALKAAGAKASLPSAPWAALGKRFQRAR